VEIGKVWTDFHFTYNPHENKARLFCLDRAGFNRYSIKSESLKDSRIQLEVRAPPVHVTYETVEKVQFLSLSKNNFYKINKLQTPKSRI